MEGLEYGVSLEDRMSGPAKSAGSSLSNLSRSMKDAMRGVLELGTGMTRVVEPAEVLRGAFEGVGAGLRSMVAGAKSGELKEVVAGAAEAFAGLAQTLDLIVPGLGQAAAAAIKAGGAFAAMTVGLVQAGIELSIEATQGKQAMIGMFSALGGGIAIGEETEEMLGKLSERTGMTKDALAPLTASFMAMGIEGTDALHKVTLAAASAQAIMGKPAAAQAFEDLTKKIQVAVQTGHGLKVPAKGMGSLADMGVRVDEVAKRMNVSSAALSEQLANGTVNAKKFGDALQDALIEKGAGPLDRMSHSFGAMKKMFDQSIGDMFEDMSKAIDPFMRQVKSLFDLFSQSKPSGQVMKGALTQAFSAIFNAASKVIPYIKHFFLDVIILSLKTYIWIKEHWSGIATAIKGVGVVLAALMVPVMLFAAVTVGGFLLAWGAIIAVGTAIGWVIGKMLDLYDEAKAAGGNFVDGFVGGITSAISKVTEAAKSLGEAAMNGVKNFLLIQSPSKLMFQLGEFTGQPFAAGIQTGVAPTLEASTDLGAAASAGAVSGMRASDYAGAVKGATGQPATPARSGGVSIDTITLQIMAPSGVTNAMEITETAIATLFERLALQQGLA